METNNLSKDEGETLKRIAGWLIDVIVKVTGGKSTFGDDNKKDNN